MGKEQQQHASELETLMGNGEAATLDLGANATSSQYESDDSDDDESNYHDAHDDRPYPTRRWSEPWLSLMTLFAGFLVVCLTLWIVFMCLYISDQHKFSAIAAVVSIDIACTCECRYAGDDAQHEACLVHWRCEDAMYGVIKDGSTRDKAYVKTFNSLIEFYRSTNEITRELIANDHHSTLVHQQEDVAECAAAFGLVNTGDGYVYLASTDGREVVDDEVMS